MPETETTQETLPTPAETAEAPPTEETPAEEPQAQPEEVKESAPSEPPWGNHDPYDVLDHEAMKPHLARRDRHTEESIRQEYQGQFEQAKRGLEASDLRRTVAGYYGNILQKLQDGDAEMVDKLVGRMDAVVEPYKKDTEDGIRGEGAVTAAQTFMAVLTSQLGRREQDEFQDFTSKRGVTWEQTVDRYFDLRATGTKKSSQDEITSLKAQIEALKAKARPEGPDTTSKGGGGGTTDDDEFLEKWGMHQESDDARAHKLLRERGIPVPTPRAKT